MLLHSSKYRVRRTLLRLYISNLYRDTFICPTSFFILICAFLKISWKWNHIYIYMYMESFLSWKKKKKVRILTKKKTWGEGMIDRFKLITSKISQKKKKCHFIWIIYIALSLKKQCIRYIISRVFEKKTIKDKWEEKYNIFETKKGSYQSWKYN